MLRELEKEYIEYHAGCGENISKSVDKAKELAKRESFRTNKHIRCVFVFNGVIMEVSEFSNTEECVNFFLSEMERHSEEYHMSDEYKQKEIERNKDLMNDQQKIDVLMLEFDRISNGPFFSSSKLIKWFMEFAPIADRTGLKYDKKKIVDYLLSHDYKPNAYLQMHKSAYEDYNIMIGYIFGQILDMFNTIGCIHPGWMSKMGNEVLNTKRY